MAKQYIYAAINPIWMNPVIAFNPIYNYLPFDFQQPQISYAQKAKKGLPQTLQVLSDWVPTFKLYNAQSGSLVDTIAGATPTSGIIGQTFTLYEFTVVWANYEPGFYFIESTYTDDSNTVQTERSGIIQMAVNFPQTCVLQYSNSYNAFSAIFSTGIIFALIVEGNIEDYSPAFEDVIYNDQEYNTTKLNAIPRREFNFYAGSNRGFAGIPPYMADKINWAFACDQLMIEGVYYQNTSNSKWEVTRADQLSPNFIGLKIPIIEVINTFLNQFQAGIIPAGSIQVISRDIKYLNNSANIAITGIFTANSVLTKIIIYNLGGDIFTINASTAADGSAPVTPPFTTSGQAKEVWLINEPFDNAASLYLLGLTGTNCNIYVQYDQLDAPAIAPIVSTKLFAKGTLYMYEEVTVGDFETDWNVGTGAGNAGTVYEGCVISGTNGTKDRNGLLAIGWNSTLPLTRDTVVGAVNSQTGLIDNSIIQTQGQVGRHTHNQHRVPAGATNPPAPNQIAVNQGNGGPDALINSIVDNQTTRGNLNPGDPDPMDISNAALVTVFFVCITT